MILAYRQLNIFSSFYDMICGLCENLEIGISTSLIKYKNIWETYNFVKVNIG